ncbi:MAG: glycosyltransferase family 4 protein, partial [Gluconacetobacter diazotrophicus]|nr:glycosyltransferase family 4 protein [Gluconacetobacter diazotrophicus]
MLLFSHPFGNNHAHQAALAVQEAGLLAELWTSFHWTPGNRTERWLPAALARQLGRRAFPAPVRDRIHMAPLREVGRMLAPRLPGGRWLGRHETGPCSVDGVFRAMDRRVARRLRRLAGGGTLRGVYAYEDGAAATFREARRQGLRCFYDLPIGYWRAGRAIFDEEAEREPAWAPTLTGRSDSAAKLARKDEEIAGADAVFVASSFTRQTLGSAPGLRAPVHVVPYGAPPVPADEPPALRGVGPLRVFFAGSLGQRKGLSYLLEAVRRFKPSQVELTLLGHKTVENCAPLDAAVRAHRWIPSLPHAEVLAEMARQDVLVFPSLFEGFGLVILEAMSRGLPTVATAHTAGPDVIEDGADGFLVPIRSADAIAEKLDFLLTHPDHLLDMKHA